MGDVALASKRSKNVIESEHNGEMQFFSAAQAALCAFFMRGHMIFLVAKFVVGFCFLIAGWWKLF